MSRVELKVDRVEDKVDTVLSTVQRTLTAVLGLANNECSYPRMFLVLPKQRSRAGNMARLFETCDRFVVVFLSEATLTPIKVHKMW